MLTSKQRSYLRGLANSIPTIFQIGKEGINENLVKQILDALEARELIKISVLNNSLLDPKEVANELVVMVEGDVVQVIGNKIILYKPSKKDPKIMLPL
ncbi:ribosome assembly RNA-binding protein YhbY [Garciella nitratireducens]|uniref:RNA-binding protein n=1 Tax=Garciella nitratireducens DSM 15102 TaxID=1121911 RepID=A0A1T4KT56_9FIRM|nr:ribosome assembly RNA-binding protein YhbY [Garciella nitratireducens]RBP39558.1 RNA-binding protein [Garciella nitratireducens]SJZ45518.1 RNA-binding protein [Garciella nitratireducens DSM 15102]